MNEIGNVNPFEVLSYRLRTIEEMLAHLTEIIDQKDYSISNPTYELLSVSEAATFLALSKQCIYRHIQRIPHYKRNGRLYFKRLELIEYIERGKATSGKTAARFNKRESR